MNDSTALDYRNPSNIRRLGIEALTKELGAIGMAHFIRQFDKGVGNYTTERDALLADVTMDEIERYLESGS